MPDKSSKTRTLISVGVICALAFVCTVFFHFRASFLTFDLKDAVMTVGAMIFGPAYGAASVIIVSLAEMLLISTTGLYGFIMNVLSSITFVLVGSVIYRTRRTLAGALFAMISAVIATTAVMLGANLVITPFYMGVSASDVAKMIPTFLLPFNLVKTIFNSALLFVIYKPIANALRSAKIIGSGKTAIESTKLTKRSVIITLSAVLIAAAALVVFFIYLEGSFSIT